MTLPRAILFDLDDTILDDSGMVVECWREACVAHAADLNGADPAVVQESIERTREWYWSDPERHRDGRLDLNGAREEVARLALESLAIDAPLVAKAIAGKYGALRDERLRPLEGAIETVHALRDRDIRTALLTNGNAIGQRKKVTQFALAPLFDAILIEGELGYGKPDPRIYERALAELRAKPTETWMVGDNLEWDVAAPQRLGIRGIWIDLRGTGVPAHRSERPDRIIRSLAELLQPPHA